MTVWVWIKSMRLVIAKSRRATRRSRSLGKVKKLVKNGRKKSGSRKTRVGRTTSAVLVERDEDIIAKL